MLKPPSILKQSWLLTNYTVLTWPSTLTSSWSTYLKSPICSQMPDSVFRVVGNSKVSSWHCNQPWNSSNVTSKLSNHFVIGLNGHRLMPKYSILVQWVMTSRSHLSHTTLFSQICATSYYHGLQVDQRHAQLQHLHLLLTQLTKHAWVKRKLSWQSFHSSRGTLTRLWSMLQACMMYQL
jgi:hypothetical protein